MYRRSKLKFVSLTKRSDTWSLALAAPSCDTLQTGKILCKLHKKCDFKKGNVIIKTHLKKIQILQYQTDQAANRLNN
jgi:hypothetical protein